MPLGFCNRPVWFVTDSCINLRDMPMKRSYSFLCLGLVSLLVAALAPGALAQPLPETVEEGRSPLSSSEVSDQEVASTAAVLVALEQHRREAEQKYGDPSTMGDAEKRELQQKLMKERQAIVQRKMIEEDLDSGRMELIIVSARRDSVLNDRVHKALEKERQNVKNSTSPPNNRDDG